MPGGNDKDEIREFLDEQLNAVEETGAVTMVGMVHHAHSGPADLHMIKTGQNKFGNPAEMAHVFDAIASRHARGVAGGGAQQYELSVCRGSNGKPTAVLPFVRVGSSSITGPSGSIATEPPTPTGQSMQAMRWGEQITQQTFAQIAHLQTSQQRALDARDTKIENMEKINADLWIACKSLLLELDKSRYDKRMQELSAARAAEFQRQAMALAPALINMMADKEIFPVSTADTAIIETIASWASPRDLEMITASLAMKPGGEKLGAMLTSRFSQYHKKKEAEFLEEKRLMTELPGRAYEEAENDAAGEALKALRPLKNTSGAPEHKELEAHGHAHGHVLDERIVTAAAEALNNSAPGDSADARLWDDFFTRVGDQAGMLLGMLAEKDPELAERLNARLAESKKRKN